MGISDVLRVLKELGANLNTPMNDGVTPIFIAAENGHIEAVRLLIESGVDINLSVSINKKTALDFAKTQSKEVLKKMQYFLKLHSDKEEVLMSPKDIAEIMGHKDIAALLASDKTCCELFKK